MIRRGGCGNSREPKRIVSSWLAAGAANGVTEIIRSPKQWTHKALPTDGAKLSLQKMGDY